MTKNKLSILRAMTIFFEEVKIKFIYEHYNQSSQHKML